MTFSYDDDADVVYVTFFRPQGKISYAQTKRGDVLRFDEMTGKIAGVTILFFIERSEKGETIEIPEVGSVDFSPMIASVLKEKRFAKGH